MYRPNRYLSILLILFIGLAFFGCAKLKKQANETDYFYTTWGADQRIYSLRASESGYYYGYTREVTGFSSDIVTVPTNNTSDSIFVEDETIYELRVSPSGNYFAARDDQDIAIWAISDGTKIINLQTVTLNVAFDWGPGENRLAVWERTSPTVNIYQLNIYTFNGTTATIDAQLTTVTSDSKEICWKGARGGLTSS